MRIRGIKPGFFLNERLADMTAHTRLLFIGLWMLADREGRLEDRPRRIHAEVFPYEAALDVEGMLSDLDACKFICRYEVDGQAVIELPTFTEHQHVNPHEQASKLPPNPKHDKARARRTTDDVRADQDVNGADRCTEESGTADPDARSVWKEREGDKNGKEMMHGASDARASASLSLIDKSQEDSGTATPSDPDADRRSDQALLEAWQEAIGKKPKTAAERRSWVKALQDLRANAELTPAGVFSLVAQYRAKLGADKIPTPGQVAGMYSQLGATIYAFPAESTRRDEQRRNEEAAAAAKAAELARLGITAPTSA